jgi:carbon starvation protein
MVWLATVTMSAGWAKLFADDPKLGFIAHAHLVEGWIASSTLPAVVKTVGDAHRMIFNDYLDAGVAAFFMISVIVIIADSIREWSAVLGGRKPVISSEVPFETGIMVPGD